MKFNDIKKIIKINGFNKKYKKNKNYKNYFFLSIGGNIGNVKENFKKFLNALKKDKRFSLYKASNVILNKAFGYTNQPDFLNAVLLIRTSLYAKEVLKYMQHYEKKFKRVRSFKNAPRTLDLDILYFDKKTRISEKLVLPHPGINDRVSVIFPIGEII